MRPSIVVGRRGSLTRHLNYPFRLVCSLFCAGPTRQACERTVKQVLQLGEGLEVAQSYLETGEE